MGHSDTTRSSVLLLCGDGFRRDMVKLTLRADGYHVIAVTSPRELHDGCTILRPALVVVDEAALPHVDRLPDVPAIILLSMASSLGHENAREIGNADGLMGTATCCLSAPWSPLELLRAVRRVRRMSRVRLKIQLTSGLDLTRASA